MTELLVKNSKIAKSSNGSYELYNFGIPAYQSKSGLKTCPMAGTCANGCYAKMGSYVWAPVINAYEWRLAQTLQDDFVEQMNKAVAIKLKTAARNGKTLVIRIHDSGDFYSIDYVNKWITIINNFPSVIFYAYTKQVVLFKKLPNKPSNFNIIYSEGGLLDNKIDVATDRHSRVFGSEQELIDAGYIDASKDDLVAAIGENHKIGLIYHGYKSKAWSTNKVA